MAITIPSFPRSANTKITLKTSAVDLVPPHGGATQRVARLADRWVYEVELRPMRAAQAGPFIVPLIQGLAQKVIAIVVQNGVDLTPYSNGTVNGAVTGGSSLVHAGGGATKFVGQYFSIVKNGVRYLHMVTGVSGQTLNFLPPLKTSLAGGETLEFGAPKIEGFIDGDEHSWTIGLVAEVGMAFRIVEGQ